MKTIKTIAAIATLSTFAIAGGDIAPIEMPAPVAPVDKDFYVGGGIAAFNNYVDGKKDFFDDTENSEISGGLEAKIGYTFYRDGDFKASIEGQAGRSLWGFDADGGYTYNYGAYMKPEYSFTSEVSAYTLAGYARTGVDFDSGFEYAESGFSYGFGGSYVINDTVSVYAEYVMLPDFDLGFETINNDKTIIGLTYSF